MGSFPITAADRDERGRIRVTPPAGSRYTAPDDQPPDDQDDAPPSPRMPAARPPLAGDTPRPTQYTNALAVVCGVLMLFVVLVAVTRYATSSPHAPAKAAADVPTAPQAARPGTGDSASRPAYGRPAGSPLLPRALIAYAAPAGEVLGALEAGRPYTPTGRFGDDWMQITTADSGAVWIHADLLPTVAMPALIDLQPPTPTPTPAPTDPPVISQPVISQPVISQPARAQCVTNMYGMACGTGDVQATAQQIQQHAEATRTAWALRPTPTAPAWVQTMTAP